MKTRFFTKNRILVITLLFKVFKVLFKVFKVFKVLFTYLYLNTYTEIKQKQFCLSFSVFSLTLALLRFEENLL